MVENRVLISVQLCFASLFHSKSSFYHFEIHLQGTIEGVLLAAQTDFADTDLSLAMTMEFCALEKHRCGGICRKTPEQAQSWLDLFPSIASLASDALQRGEKRRHIDEESSEQAKCESIDKNRSTVCGKRPCSGDAQGRSSEENIHRCDSDVVLELETYKRKFAELEKEVRNKREEKENVGAASSNFKGYIGEHEARNFCEDRANGGRVVDISSDGCKGDLLVSYVNGLAVKVEVKNTKEYRTTFEEAAFQHISKLETKYNVKIAEVVILNVYSERNQSYEESNGPKKFRFFRPRDGIPGSYFAGSKITWSSALETIFG